MFTRLSILNYPSINTPFSLINTILLKQEVGLVFKLEEKDSFFLFNPSGFSYLSMFDWSNENCWENLTQLVKSNFELSNYFHLYQADINETLIQYFKKKGIGYKVRKRSKFQYLSKGFDDKELKQAQKLDLKQLAFISNSAFQEWRKFGFSENSFVKNSIASIIDIEGQLASICYAAAIDNHEAEIDIYTSPLFRKKAFGSIVAKHFINQSLEHNLIPSWDAFHENAASINLATKLGFNHQFEYQLLSIFIER